MKTKIFSVLALGVINICLINSSFALVCADTNGTNIDQKLKYVNWRDTNLEKGIVTCVYSDNNGVVAHVNPNQDNGYQKPTGYHWRSSGLGMMFCGNAQQGTAGYIQGSLCPFHLRTDDDKTH